jgi:RNA polymerase sigma-70 factor (ECF subfamily)
MEALEAIELSGGRSESSEITDHELVDGIRKGDALAFDLLYDRYFKRVYRFVAKRLNIRADVEETTQEVFIAVFSSIESFRGEAPVSAWIFGISRRVIASRFKRKRHVTVPLDDQDHDHYGGARSSVSNEPTPLEVYEYQERIDQMDGALENRLSEQQRFLFEQHHIHAIPISEIAAATAKSENSVKSNLYRARKLLLSR